MKDRFSLAEISTAFRTLEVIVQIEEGDTPDLRTTVGSAGEDVERILRGEIQVVGNRVVVAPHYAKQ